jgi:hypothetical protein
MNVTPGKSKGAADKLVRGIKRKTHLGRIGFGFVTCMFLAVLIRQHLLRAFIRVLAGS